MPMISKAFEQSNLSLADMDLLVCDKGPGSFTGIRIGVATINAFHDSLNIPCIGVSSLESLAYLIKTEGLILSMLDCKNNNCYFALYELKNSKYYEIIPPSSATLVDALNLCNTYIKQPNKNLLNSDFLTIVGDVCLSGSYQDIIKNTLSKNIKLQFSEQNELSSYYLGLAGLNKFKQTSCYATQKSSSFDDDFTNDLLINDTILPLYLKKPQAQRQLEEKLQEVEISEMTIENLNYISSKLDNFDDFWNSAILKDEFTSLNSHYIVAKLHDKQDKIIGFAGIKIIMDEANIMNIAVEKNYRNQGIGSLLLENLISLSEKLNMNSLEVMEENYPAIHLYQKFGFKKCGVRKNYYKNQNAIIMTAKREHSWGEKGTFLKSLLGD